MVFKKFLMRSSAAIALFAPIAGLAQTTASPETRVEPPAGQSRPAAAIETGGIEDIIVTARKRQESVLNVPVVETVLSQARLEQSATQDLYRLKTFVPGLLIGLSTNSVGLQVSLRGVGTTAQNPTVDQSVALNIDGLPLTQGNAYQAGMFDVGQIEVLKGPQSLFYGKNSPGGVISLRSADPTDEFEIVGRGGYEFVANEKSTELIVSGPINDWLKLRVAGRYSDSDGYFRNTPAVVAGFGSRSPASNNIPASSVMLRGTALITPDGPYSARLKVNYTRDHTSGLVSPLQPVYCPDGTGAVGPRFLPFLNGSNCTLGRDYKIALPDPAAFPGGLPNNGNYFSNSKQYFGTLEQNLVIAPGLTLNSVTGYYQNDYTSLMHGSTTSGIAPFVQNYTFSNKQFTQEMRLTSDFKDSRINFMVGGFYQYAKLFNEGRILGNSTLGLPTYIQYFDHHVGVDSGSVFGQLLFDITDKLELAGGARYTDETRTHRENNFNPTNGPVGPVTLLDPRLHSNNVSPEVSLTYKPTTDFTVFGSYKQGFKSGSFNSVNYVSPTTPGSFLDEKVKGFEGGLKSRFFDRHLSFNLAGYSYRYSDLQVGALELQQAAGGTFVFVQRTLNAASARVKGVEGDFTFEPAQIPGLAFRGSANYNHARYLAFPNAPCGNGQTIAQGCNQLFNATLGRYGAQDLSGRRLVRAPDWAFTLGSTYETKVGPDLNVIFGGDVNYTSSYSTTLVDLPGFAQSRFAKVNLNVTVQGRNKGWEVALIGNNVTDKLTRGLCFNSNVQNGTILGGQVSGTATQGPAGGDEAVCAIDYGRQVLLRLTLRPMALFGR